MWIMALPGTEFLKNGVLQVLDFELMWKTCFFLIIVCCR